MNKENLKKFISSKLGIGLIIGIICFCLGSCNTLETKDKLLQANKVKENLECELSSAHSKITELQNDIAKAKPWFDEQEKKKKAEEAKAEAEKKAKEEKEVAEKAKIEAEQKAKEEAKEKRAYTTGLSSQALLNLEDGFTGKKFKYTGKILNCRLVRLSANSIAYDVLLAINDDENNKLFLSITTNQINGELKKGDQLTVYAMGLQPDYWVYGSGRKIKLPYFASDYVEQH